MSNHEALRDCGRPRAGRLPARIGRCLPRGAGDPDLGRHAALRPLARVRLRRRQDAEPRCAAARFDSLPARIQPLPNDPAVASIDSHRAAADRARRPQQHRLPIRRDEVPHAGRGAARARLPHRRGGVVVRAALRHRDRCRLRFLRRQHRRRGGRRGQRAPALRLRNAPSRAGVDRPSGVAAVLFLLPHLRAAHAVRAVVRRRDREVRRHRRTARGHAQIGGPLRPRHRDLSFRSRRRAMAARGGPARNPPLPRVAAGAADGSTAPVRSCTA